eukprot:CAMPEP_0114625128 /NCGR_PEP_ID=MMETSP0168-20121206/11114_1 /TAXON_ID=95228 ORGANISM="Vannella sp., Strain DIVA3 517/6/12" /NCGR_SAMPLE_ID=MMETSP0168 /ASSEMBLY_ACC=CAM_ASM_000044 /LENGTH=707 /DNA_ID=CAMNT_0001836407 /DNA_START=22 /DNA_END=2143 /DNA_ORIENTATION=+
MSAEETVESRVATLLRELEGLASTELLQAAASAGDEEPAAAAVRDAMIALEERWGKAKLAAVFSIPELSWLQHSEEEYFDELYKSNGKPRGAYAGVLHVLKRLEGSAPERIDAFPAQSLKDFEKDNSLYHLPRMLTPKQHQRLYRGVRQRGRALQQFVCDFYSSERKFMKAKIIPGKLLKEIIRRNLDMGMMKVFQTDSWSFWYGPDIIRGPDGSFYCCEDNAGYCGGFGDLVIARKSLLTQFPEYGPEIVQEAQNPMTFYRQLSKHYHSFVKKGEKVVLLHYPMWMTADNEERRVVKLFRKVGIDSVVIPVGSSEKKKNKKKKKPRPQLVVTDSGVELVSHGPGGEQRTAVGMVVIDAEPFDVDPRNSSVRRKLLLDEARYWLEDFAEELAKAKAGSKKAAKLQEKHDALAALLAPSAEDGKPNYGKITRFLRQHQKKDFKEVLEQGVPGLLEAYFAGKVHVTNGPGFDFMQDKLFCTYVDELIRFYLGEEPIIKAIPTRSFARSVKDLRKARRANKRALYDSPDPDTDTDDDEERLDRALWTAIFEEAAVQDKVVVKRVDGRGGDAVWVGPKISRTDFLAAKPLVEAEPGAFIVQQYIPLSQVDGQLVDLRCLANVSAKEVIVSDVFWGRGVPADGSNGKVNISDRGFEFCICTAVPPKQRQRKEKATREKKAGGAEKGVNEEEALPRSARRMKEYARRDPTDFE